MTIATETFPLSPLVPGQPAALLAGMEGWGMDQLSLAASHPARPWDRAVWQEGLARFVMSEIWFRVQRWGNQG